MGEKLMFDMNTRFVIAFAVIALVIAFVQGVLEAAREDARETREKARFKSQMRYIITIWLNTGGRHGQEDDYGSTAFEHRDSDNSSCSDARDYRDA